MFNQRGFTKNELMYGIPVLVLVIGLCLWWYLYEQAKIRDMVLLSGVQQADVQLELYYRDFGVYPPASPDTHLNDDAQSCLVREGFFASTSDACRQRGRFLFSSLFAASQKDVPYTPLDETGALCTKKEGCASYRINFVTETGIIAKHSGLHVLTPSGIQ